jgi:hypothetical protein
MTKEQRQEISALMLTRRLNELCDKEFNKFRERFLFNEGEINKINSRIGKDFTDEIVRMMKGIDNLQQRIHALENDIKRINEKNIELMSLIAQHIKDDTENVDVIPSETKEVDLNEPEIEKPKETEVKITAGKSIGKSLMSGIAKDEDVARGLKDKLDKMEEKKKGR